MKVTDPSPFAALSDPTRRAILRCLRSGPLGAGDLASRFNLAKPTLSHHFRILETAGLIRSERQGTRVVYAQRADALRGVAEELLALCSQRLALSARPAKRSRR
ncbi:MAG TPA: metalloregulator ArsR/SmtB family transcription factor [Myxococcaceae bacterium]|nr:metalloregulator ArsR/SmtB family transcription factor [Myxococcaceae bacterium]